MVNYTNYAAECEILSQIMQENDLIFKANEILEPVDFSHAQTRAIYEQALIYSRNRMAISAVSLHDAFKGSEITLSKLMEIQTIAATTKDIHTYISIVKENSRKRKLSMLLHRAAEELKSSSAKEVSHGLMSEIYKVGESITAGNLLDDSEAMTNAIDFIDKAIQSNGETIGMRSGWTILDAALKGFHSGDLVIIGARPSMGKTVFALNLAERLAERYRVAIFELEMSHEKLELRRLAAKSNIKLNKLYQAHTLSQSELSIVMRNANLLHERNTIITDTTPRIRIEDIRARLHYFKTTRGVDLVIIDHIGLMKMDRRFTNRNEGIGDLTAKLKELAKEFNVCIIVLSQLSRELERRDNRRPMLSDLRDSGSLEQDADVVLLLYREGYYESAKENLPEVENLEVNVAKNRDGNTGKINLGINLQKQIVEEYYT